MHKAPFHRLPVPFVEGAAAEFVIPALLREQRIDHDQEAMRHRHSGTFGAPSCRQPPLLGREIGVFGARRRLRRFDQSGAHPGTAFAGAPTAALAGTLIVTWTQARPRREVARGGEAGEVYPNLCHQYLGGPPADPRNALHPHHLGLKRAHALRDLGADPLQDGIEEVDVGERHGR